MPPVYTTDDGRFKVIRPLIECAESDILAYAQKRAFPILPCNLCGSQSGLQRVKMGDLLDQLEEQIPNVRDVMLASLKNVRPTHLLDPTLSSSRSKANDVDTQDCTPESEDASLVSIDG